VAIAWTLQDAGSHADRQSRTATIITATITDAGTYNVALSGPIDHSTANQRTTRHYRAGDRLRRPYDDSDDAFGHH